MFEAIVIVVAFGIAWFVSRGQWDFTVTKPITPTREETKIVLPPEYYKKRGFPVPKKPPILP